LCLSGKSFVFLGLYMNFNQLLHLSLFGSVILILAKKLPVFSMRRPVAFFMLIALVGLSGLGALKLLPLELMPDISYGNVTIFIDVRGGMPPPEVERLVTKPVEAAMGTVSKLKNIISTSKKHRSIVTLEFEAGTDMDLATLETREKFLRIKSQLPREIERPVIAHYEEADAPVVIAALTSPHYSPEELRQIVEESLKEKLLRVEGVANVEIGGGRQRKILVELDMRRLVALGLPFKKIVSVLEQNNLNVRVGDIEGNQSLLGLRTLGAFKTIEEIKQIGIAVTEKGGIIRLADLGQVKDDYLEPESYSRLNAKAAVTLYIQKESMANTVQVVDRISRVLNTFKKNLTKDIELLVVSNQGRMIRQAIKSVAMTLCYGMALVILILSLFLSKTRTTRWISLGFLTGLMVMLIIMTILSIPLNKTLIIVSGMIITLLIISWWRRDLLPAFIVAGSIPISLFITLAWMYFEQVSLNVISLSGLILGIGLLVDNSIVVLENIERYKKRISSLTKQELIKQAVQEVIIPMIGGTLTTIVVFLPFSLLQKQVQLLYTGIAFTVTTILLASLLSAISLVPALMYRIKDKDEATESIPSAGTLTALTCISQKQKGGRYNHLPPGSELPHFRAEYFNSRNWRKLFKAYFKNLTQYLQKHWLFLSFISFPSISAFFYLTLDYPLDISAYLALIIIVMAIGLLLFRHYNLILKWFLNHRLLVLISMVSIFILSALIFWYRLPKDFMATQEQGEFVVFIELASGVRLDISNQVVREVEERIQETPTVKEAIKSISAKVEGWSSKVYVTLKPRSERSLSTQEVINRLRSRLKNIGEAYDTFIYFSEPRSGKEIFVEVYGHNYETLAHLAMQIANGMAKIPKLSDIKVRYRPGRPEARVLLNPQRVSMLGLNNQEVAETIHAQLRGLRATKFYDQQEEIETVVRLDPRQCETIAQLKNLMLATSEGFHVPVKHFARMEFGLAPSEIWHRQKVRMIQVSANLGAMPLSQAAESVKTIIRQINFPEDYYADIGGDYEQMIAADKSFKLALVMTIILIFMVMACLFESLIQPFIIMITVLLSGIGAIAGLTLTDSTVSLGVSIGLLMLGGMVVNNGIILVDRINQLRLAYPEVLLPKIISWAGRQRLRPIFITTITTICGLLPMALDQSESAVMWRPLAITVISGLSFSTILTLFIVPCFYLLVESAKRQSNRFLLPCHSTER